MRIRFELPPRAHAKSHTFPPLARELFRQAAEGQHLWGRVDVSPSIFRSLAAAEVSTIGGHEVVGDIALLRSTARRLTELDNQLSAGEINAVEHEARPLIIYESLPAGQTPLAA